MGQGAEQFGGRWNPVGVPVAYASLSLSLAVLETFVHMTMRTPPRDYVSIAIDLAIRESEAERVSIASLPRDWRRINHPELQALGAEWARSGRSLALLVPSAVIEEEWNVLINPRHPKAKILKISEPKAFYFDERMFR
jgi:RES domain-containing protein